MIGWDVDPRGPKGRGPGRPDADLGAIDPTAVAQQMRRLTEVIADRRRYIEVIA
jgi:hypothetical protein